MFEGDVHREKGVELSETVGDLFDVVRSEPAIIPEGATLRDAIDAIVARETTRKAYIVDSEGRIKGTISMETLMRHVGYRLGARPRGVISFLRFVRDMESDDVKNFMAKPVVVTKQTNLVEVVRRVVEDHLNDFPIVDEHGKLLGELNTLHLLKAVRGLFRRPEGAA